MKNFVTGEELPPIQYCKTDEEVKAAENELVQKCLRKLSPEREQLLLSAGVTIHNFGDKAAKALRLGNMQLAEAITGKYILPPD